MGVIFEIGQKADVATTYPLDLFIQRAIIDVCTLGRQRFTRMGRLTTIGLWWSPIAPSAAPGNAWLPGWGRWDEAGRLGVEHVAEGSPGYQRNLFGETEPEWVEVDVKRVRVENVVDFIIQNYHKGRIFVKSSTLDKGTTFRIILKKKSKR